MPHVAHALVEADLTSIDRLVIQPPLVNSGWLTDGTYILNPDFPAIQAAVQQLLAGEAGPARPTD
jgi:hypothetical protein